MHPVYFDWMSIHRKHCSIEGRRALHVMPLPFLLYYYLVRRWGLCFSGGYRGGVPGVVTPPSGPSMNIIIMPRVYEYHYCSPRVYLSAAMKRSTSILAYFPTSSKRARGAVRLHDCKWRIMLLLSRSPNGCALVR